MTLLTSRKNMIIAITAAASLMTGCTSMQTGANHRPIVDGTNLPNYEQDVAQCQELARQRDYLNDQTQADAAIGAVIGALAGSDGDRGSIIGGALLVGIAGASSGALDARTERRNIVITCMEKRGYQTVESIIAVQ